MSELLKIFPVCGNAQRFFDAGYTVLKPLIEVKGKTLIEWAVDSLQLEGRLVFIIRRDHDRLYQLGARLKDLFNCTIVYAEGPTEGAACTVLLAEHLITDAPLVISNCDQYYEWDVEGFQKTLRECDPDGAILTFQADHPKWSYVKVDPFGYISEVAEKKVISDQATCVSPITRILLSNGKTEAIGKIVNQKLSVEVMTYNEVTKQLEPSRITKYIKNREDKNNWYLLELLDLPRCNVGHRSLTITRDHKVLTKRGWLRVDNLDNNDKIITKYLLPNKKHKEFIDGTLLGDAFFRKPGGGELGRLVFKHGLSQKSWIDFKTNILSFIEHASDFEKPREQQFENRIIKGKGTLQTRFASNPYWTEQRQRWYPNGKKIVPRDLIITPLVLAAWYMDDGSLGSEKNRCVFCTEGFAKEDVLFLQDKLLELGFVTFVSKKNNGFAIYMSNGGMNKDENNYHYSFNKFCELISPYIIPSMQYKLPQEYQGKYDSNLYNLGDPEKHYSSIRVIPFSESEKKDRQDMNYSYCLQVEKNSNIIASDVVIKNCGTYYWKNGRDFVDSVHCMMEANDRVNNEFYIAPTFNYLIKESKKNISFNVERMVGLGTPEDLNIFKNE